MATGNAFRTLVNKVFGPTRKDAIVDFTTSGGTGAVTTNEAFGATVARTGVGVFTITLANSYKHSLVTMAVQAATTAQLFIVTSRTANTVVITQVTAGGGTAVDTLAARINVRISSREQAAS